MYLPIYHRNKQATVITTTAHAARSARQPGERTTTITDIAIRQQQRYRRRMRSHAPAVMGNSNFRWLR